MSRDRSSLRTFDLEGLEPRLLLSADGLGVGELRPLQRAESLQVISVSDSAHVIERDAAAESDLFSGVEDEPLVAPAAADSSGQEVLEDAANDVAEPAPVASYSVVPTAATTLNATSLTGQSDLLSEQLTTTLTAANGPPGGANTQDLSSFAFDNADSSTPIRVASTSLSDLSAFSDDSPDRAADLPANTVELGALRITTLSVSLPTLESLFDGSGTSVSITGSISIDGFFYLSGTFTISAPTSASVTVLTGDIANPTISNVEVWALSISAVDVYAFVGAGGPQKIDANNNGVLEEAEPDNPEAVGLAISGLDIGLVIMKTKTTITHPSGGVPEVHSFYALRATADYAGLIGVGSAFQLDAYDIEVNVNTGNPWVGTLITPVVDFSGAGEFSIPTGGDPIVIDYDGRILAASADRVLLRISDFVYISGGFSIRAGGVQYVDVQTNLTPTQATTVLGSLKGTNADNTDTTLGATADGDMIFNLPVQTLEIGLSDVDVFVGYTDPDSNVLETAAEATGELTEDDLLAAQAIGVFLDEADLGILLSTALQVPQLALGTGTLNTAFLKFFSLRASANTVALIGVPALDLRADELEVRVNQGSFVPAVWPVAPGLFPPPVIDFLTSFPTGTHSVGDPDNGDRTDGFRVRTGTSASAYQGLYYNDPVVGASADRVLLRISDFVYVSGGFSFNKGGVEHVDVRTNLNSTQSNSVLGPLKGTNPENTGTTLGAAADGSMIFNLPVQTIEVGLSNVDVFVGYTDPDSNVLETAAKDTGELTKDDLLDAQAIGLFLDEADLGMMLSSALPVTGAGTLNTAFLKFFSLRAGTDLVELIGVPGLNLSVEELEVRVNQGSFVPAAWPVAPGLFPPPVIDYLTSYPDGTHSVGDPDNDDRTDGYRVQTGTSATVFQGLYYDNSVVGASADRVLLRISDFVYVSGAFSFNKGQVEYLDIRTNLNETQATPVLGLLKGSNADNTGTTLGAAADGSMIFNLPVQTIEVGLSNVDVFVGYTDPDSDVLETAATTTGELTRQNLLDAQSIGLFLDEADLGLLLGSALPVVGAGTLNTAFLKFTSLRASAATVELLGVPGLDLRVDELEVRVNQGSYVPATWPVAPGLFPPPVIDFLTSYPNGTHSVGDPDNDDRTDGYRVQTGTSATFYQGLYYNNSVVGASADRVLLRISDFVYVSGAFSFNKGQVEYLDIKTNLNETQATPVLGLLKGANADNTGTTLGAAADGSMIFNLPVQTIEVGLSNVDVFVGYTDPDSNVLETAAKDTGELTKADLLAANSIGLFLDEAALGLLFGSAMPVAQSALGTGTLNAAFLKFTSLRASADLVELIGVPGLNLSVEELEVRVNQGSYVPAAWPVAPGLFPPPVIDFPTSYPDGTHSVGDPDNDDRTDGYRVQTGTSATFYQGLYYDNSVVGASADRVLLRISDFVYISGAFSFNKGQVEYLDIKTNLNETQATPVLGLLKGANADNTGTTLGASADGSMIFNLPVQTIEVGLSNVDVFVGYTDPDSDVLETAAVDTGELTKADLLAANSIGLFLDEAALGLLFGSAMPVAQTALGVGTLNTAFLKFTSLRASADLVELIGVPGLNLSVEELEVRVNQGSYVPAAWPVAPGLFPPPVIDFPTSYPDGTHSVGDPDNDDRTDGYRVQTGTSETFYQGLYYDNSVVGASADRVLLRISDFVYISGAFSFNKGQVEYVDVKTNLNELQATPVLGLLKGANADNTGTTLGASADGSMIFNLPVQTIEVGMSNVDVFVGYTDPDSDVLETAAVDTGELTETDLLAADAIGVFLDEADLGLLLSSALPVAQTALGTGTLNAAFLKFTSLRASADTVKLIGVPGLDLEADMLEVRVNQGSFAPGAWPVAPNLFPPPVIDFLASYPTGTHAAGDPDNGDRTDGYRVQTGTSATFFQGLYYDNVALGASADRVLLRVSDFVYVSGGFSFNKGRVEHVDVKTNLSELEATAVLGSLKGANADNTGTTLGASADGSMIYNLPIQTIEVGLSNVDVFVGYTDPGSNVLENAAKSTGELTEADLLAAKAVGLLVDEANLGMVIGSAMLVSQVALGTGTLNAAALKFFSLIANADLVGLVGVPGIEVSGRGIRVEVNSGSKFPIAPTAVVGPAVDWALSFPDTDGGGTDDVEGYEVATGTTTDPVVLAMSQFIIGGGVENIHIELGDFVYIDGAIYFEMGTAHTVQLADSLLPAGDLVSQLGLDPTVESLVGATEKDVVFLSIGGKDLQAFFGVDGPYWVDFDNDGEIDRDPVTHQIVDAETNDEAVGLVIDNLTFGLTFATPTNSLDPSRYVALKGSANLIGLVGMEDYITMRAEDITVELNISTPLLGGFPLLPVIDWVDSFGPEGYGVKTGARNLDLSEITVDLDMDELLIKAGIGFMTMDVLGIVSLSGSIGVEIGPSADVTLASGGEKEVKTLSFGAANVYGFIGYNGPYVHDSNGNGYVDRLDFATNLDGSIGAPLAVKDGLAGRPKAVGFAINDLDIGILLMVATDPLDAGVYLAAKLDVESFGLVGIDGLTATGGFDVELNVGFGLSGLDPDISPVDLGASFSEAPALFALMDTNTDHVLDQAEQNAALASGYVGESITTAAQLVSILNAANGPPDDYLTITEVETKLKDSFEASHQAAIDALDADDNGRLNTGYEVFTGNAATPIVLDADNFLISIQLGGEIKLDGVFRMYGVFLFEADTSGLKAFVAAGIEIGPDIGAAANNKIFTMNALGALVINGAGLAADIQVSASVGGALQSVLSLNASARLLFNTTGVDQTITIPERYAGFLTGDVPIAGALPASPTFDPAQSAALAVTLGDRLTPNADGSLTFTIDRRALRLDGTYDAPGSYFLVALHGDLTIARTFVISADFQLKISTQGLELGYNGTIDLGGFITVDVEGGAVIENGVFAAYARLEIDIDVAGINISGGADFEINSGTATKSVYDALGNEHVILGTTYMVSVDATIDLFGVLTATGDVRIGIEDGNFLIDVDATLSFFGILDVEISGYFNTNGTFSFTGSLDLDLTVGSGAGEFGITGGLSVTLSNSGFSGHGEVGLVVLGEDINIASATVTVNWDTGAWLIRAEGPLSVWLEVSTDGAGGYEIDGGLGFFDDVLEVLGDVADAIAEGVVAAANAVADAIVDLGEAILEFGEDVVEFFEDVGEAIADAAEAVWDAISGYFEDERTIITQTPVNPRDHYQYSTSLVAGTLTINNGTSSGYAQQLTVWVVDGNVIVDAPDYTKNVEISRSQKQERDYEWDGLPPWGQWSDWYNVGSPQIQTTNINITNASAFALGSVTKIVINGTDNSETIILDRNTISINADVDAKGGNDVIATGKGNDRVWARGGNDIIFTYEGNDELYGEDGNDKLFGGTGNDLLNGGAGDDLLDENKDRLDPSVLLAETNTLIGGSGKDTILGSPGKDTIHGDSDNDILLGLSHDDTYVFNNGYGTDQFVDYSGKETLDFSGTTNVLTVTMAADGLTATDGTGSSLAVDELVWITQLNLGSGSDGLTITELPNRLFTITDAGGTDRVTVDDSADTANNTGVLTSSRLTGLGMGNADQSVVESDLGIAYSNIEDLRISLGSGDDTFTISSTHSGAGKTTLLNTGAGADTVHINGASSGLTINSQGQADTINVNGTSAGSVVVVNTGDDNDVININATSGTTTANGGNGSDTFNVNGTGAGSTSTLNGEGGTDIFNLKAIGGGTTVNGGNDADTFNVGSSAAGVVGNAGNNSGGMVDSIAALLTINGDASASDVLNVDESGDGNANIGTLTSDTITGLDMAGSITYHAVELLNLNLGSLGDIITVASTHVSPTRIEGRNGNDQFTIKSIAGTTEIAGQGGADTFTVGNNVSGVSTVNGIQALLDISGGSDASTDVLVVSEVNEDAGSSVAGTLTSTRLTGLGMAAAGGVDYTEIETLGITLGQGGDTFNIQSTFAATVTTLNTGAGANTVNVGSLAPAINGNVNAIAGRLVVNGQGSADTLNVDDRGDTLANTGLLTANRLTGLGMAADDASKGIEYAAVETLNIYLGSGGDNFTIQTTHAGVTVLNTFNGADRVAINATSGNTTVNAGADADTINVGSAASVTTNAGGNLNAIQGALTINGEDGSSDTINLDDTADSSPNAGTLSSNQLTGLGMIAAGITYNGFETLNLNLGSAGDTLIVASTHAALTHIEARAGPDQIFIRSIAGRTEIAGQDGADTITVGNGTLGAFHTVDGIQALLVLTGGTSGDTDTLFVTEVDEAAAATALGTLTATTITGLGMSASGGVTYTEFEILDITLGQGGDTFVIASTHTALTTLKSGAGNDQVNIATLSGETRIRGEAGDDTVRVNVNADGTERIVGGATVNGVGAYLDIDGQLGSDTTIIYLAGVAHSAGHPVSLINVHDTGGSGSDFMDVYGTDQELVSDSFLIRRNFIALLPDVPTGGTATAERINYDGSIDAGVAIHGRAGADEFVFDDNSTTMTVDGGDGNDSFQLGQMFQSERVSTPAAIAAVAAGDEVSTVHTTQGFLTPGISFETTIHGGDGNDQFLILSNRGPLSLLGEDGNDKFIVRAFALYGSEVGDPLRAGTNINTGLGTDEVEYNINAPVDIDGGDGFDTIVVLGTEFSDLFVITKDGVTGAGLFVSFANIERVDIDGLEGNDYFHILSTDAAVVTRVFGSLGSDTFVVGGDASTPGSVNEIQGPLIVEGGRNPETLTDLPEPLLYLGEIDLPLHVPVPNSNFDAIEADQIDSLWVYDNADATDNIGTLTGSLLSGLGMGSGLTQGPDTYAGGISYANLEMVSVFLGGGADTFELLGTHSGETLVDGGPGADHISVRTVLGHATVLGGAGDDAIALGASVSGGSTIDALRALVTIDGGAGNDTTSIADTADTNANNGTLDSTTLIGLDLLEAQVSTFEIDNVFAGTFVLTVAGLSTPALPVAVTAAQIRDALVALGLPGVSDIAVNRADDVVVVGFLGDETLAAGSLAVTATGSVLASDPWMLNRIQTISLSASSGTFAVTIGSAGPVFSITVGDSANTVRDAIIAALNTVYPANGIGIKDVVVSRFGSNYEVLFQGLLSGPRGAPHTFSVVPVGAPGDLNFVEPIAVAQRTSGVDYYGVDTLNLDLGSGSDVLNIRGTSAFTNVTAHDGDERIYVSSHADETLGSAPTTDFLAGHLDRIRGTLNLDLGTGRHLLMISDESSLNGDGTAASPVLITDQPVSGLGLPATDITITGLSQAPAITYRAAPAGTFAEGITIWTGWGADTIRIDGTHQRGDGAIGSLRTVTTLNTGLGNDSVTVDLAASDGFFVLNTQGPVNSSPGVADNDSVDGSTSTRPLVIFGGQGNDSITGGHAADIIFGDRGTVTYSEGINGVGVLGNGGPGDRTDGVERLRSLIATTFPGIGGNDTIHAGDGNNVVLGGHGADTIVAGSGDDAVLGDHGYLDYILRDNQPADLDQMVSTDVTHGGADSITTGAGADLVIGGPDGDTILAGNGRNLVIGDQGRITSAAEDANRLGTHPITIGLVETIDFGFGGADTITSGSDNDVILGGHAGDSIDAGDGDNVVAGDDAVVDYVRQERDGAVTGADSSAADVDRFESISTTTAGGADTITTGTGNDLVLGGRFGDTITDHGGNDVILGDSGAIIAADANTPRNGSQAITIGQVTVLTPADGGADLIHGGAGNDAILGGAGMDEIHGQAGDDLIFGDTAKLGFADGLLVRVETMDNEIGGADTILGGDGNDMIVGGAYGDRLDGGAGEDLVVGDNAILDRTGRVGVRTSLLHQALTGTLIYDIFGSVLVNGVPANEPGGSPVWADFTLALLDHSFAEQAAGTTRFGNDYLAGGAGDDRLFGGLGDDTIQGDGSIALEVSARRLADGTLEVLGSVEAATDGDDYIEGNGGNDLVFGGLGQDDIIGGSSSFFGLNSRLLRPDGADMIFGGAGTDLARNNEGDTSATGRARDADAIAGDNANIVRVVGLNGVAGGYQTFGYDNYGALKLIPRAVQLLDYTPGGADLDAAAAALDIGAADEIHGESGNDSIYGQLGNDVLFGEGQDDDLIGGTGADWISGGAGDDGALGDDGRIHTSRNGTAEPLYGIAAIPPGGLNDTISTPGNMQSATINVAGALKKTAILEPFMLAELATLPGSTPANDIVFGGLGNDAIHGGAGDDALSGAEALPHYYARPANPGDILRWNQTDRAGEFAAYDEYNPLTKIFVDPVTFEFTSSTTPGAVEFILNFVATEQDGSDVIFGDVGNDWAVGGMGRDHLYGGYGDDLLNADDNHDTAGGLNNVADGPDANQEDLAYGGAGRDILIGNTGGDRLIDWAGEFNSYIVPFAPFGAAAISRALQPLLMEFLYALSASDGADPTRATKTGSSAARNGEPEGELGLVRQQDFDWGDQTGAPDDPQPGNIPGGARDVLRSANFNNGTADGFSADSGNWEVTSGRFQVTPSTIGGDAVSVFYVDDQIARYYEVQATVNAVKPTAGFKANGYLIFDYQSATDFKFAGIDVSTNKLVMGHRDASGWKIDVQKNMQLKAGQDYNMLLSVNGVTATLVIDNSSKNVLSFAFSPRVIDGYSFDLNTGMVGIGGNNSRAQIDNVTVQVLPPTITLTEVEDFSDGAANLLTAATKGLWSAAGGRYAGATDSALGMGVSNFDLGLGAASLLTFDITGQAGANGTTTGIVFDYYDATNFKFAGMVAGSNQIVIGHHTKSGWTIDATMSRTIAAGTDYTMSVSLKGTTVSVSVDGQAAVGFVFNAVVTDAQAGLFTRGGGSLFSGFSIETDDPQFSPGG